jgi:hypothetical protein
LGLAGLAAGAVAVFITDVEAGPVALLLVGLFLLLVAASGRLPSHVKYKDSEASWAIEEFVERVVEEASREQVPKVIEALNGLRDTAPAAAAAGLGVIASGQAYEEFVTEMLRRAVDEINASNVMTPTLLYETPEHVNRGRDLGADMIIRRPGHEQQTLWVQTKFTTDPLRPLMIKRTMNQVALNVAQSNPAAGPTRGLLVTNASVPLQTRVTGTERLVDVFTLNSETDLAELIGKIRSLFGL